MKLYTNIFNAEQDVEIIVDNLWGIHMFEELFSTHTVLVDGIDFSQDYENGNEEQRTEIEDTLLNMPISIDGREGQLFFSEHVGDLCFMNSNMFAEMCEQEEHNCFPFVLYINNDKTFSVTPQNNTITEISIDTERKYTASYIGKDCQEYTLIRDKHTDQLSYLIEW